MVLGSPYFGLHAAAPGLRRHGLRPAGSTVQCHDNGLLVRKCSLGNNLGSVCACERLVNEQLSTYNDNVIHLTQTIPERYARAKYRL